MVWPATAVPSVSVAGVVRLSTGASLTSTVAGTFTDSVSEAWPSVTVTFTAGRSPPAFTRSAPACVSVTTPVSASML